MNKTDSAVAHPPRPHKVRKSEVAEEWNEGHPDAGGDGYWIALKAGWKSASDPVGAVHSIHEDTAARARAESVLPCRCDDCCAAIALAKGGDK